MGDGTVHVERALRTTPASRVIDSNPLRAQYDVMSKPGAEMSGLTRPSLVGPWDE